MITISDELFNSLQGMYFLYRAYNHDDAWQEGLMTLNEMEVELNALRNQKHPYIFNATTRSDE